MVLSRSLLDLGRLIGVLHLRILLLWHGVGAIIHDLCGLLSFPLLLCGLLYCLLFCALLGGGFFGGLSSCILLFLSLVVEALDDWAGGCAEFVELGNVLGLLGVFAVFVEPVLRSSQYLVTAPEC